MKRKLLLLATASVLLFPVAATPHQTSSIFVGLVGTLERLASQGAKPGVSDYLKDETFFEVGVEAGYGYKVWDTLQVVGVLRALYSFEHTFADKTYGQAPSAIIVEPRVTLGWEIPVSETITITPFCGVGIEMNFAQKDAKDYSMDWKIPAVFGTRCGLGSIYVSLNGRYDLTLSDISKKLTRMRPTQSAHGVSMCPLEQNSNII